MSRLVLCDTGPLYALADPSDQYHSRACDELAVLADTGIAAAILYPTLAECYTLVLRRLGRKYAGDWLKELAEGALLFNPDPGDYARAQDILAKYEDQPLTLFDAVVGSISLRMQVPVWSYDRHFDVMRVARWAR